MRGLRPHSSTLPSAVVLSTDARTMGNDPSKPDRALETHVVARGTLKHVTRKHADGEELSTPPPPPPGAVLMKDREYGALGLAKIRTFLTNTPEGGVGKVKLLMLRVVCCTFLGGLGGTSGHPCYPYGNTLTFQDEEGGIEQLLKDRWPDAWLAIQPVLAQVNKLTIDAWYGRSTCPCSNVVVPSQYLCCLCFSNTFHKHRGVIDVHQRLTASAWIIMLNEVLNPHGLAADLYEKSTYHIHPPPHLHHKDNGPTTYSATTDIDLHLRLFLWSARAAQAASQLTMQVDMPPGAVGGHSITIVGPDRQQYQTLVPPGLMPAQFFVFHVPASAATAPPTQTMQVTVPSGVAPGQTIATLVPDGKQYTMTVPDGLRPGQSFQFNLPPDAAWWRTVEPPQAAPAQQIMVRPVFALYSQPSLAHWSVGYA